MAGAYSTVDLSQLQAPDVVEQLDYEQIVAEMIADLRARDPAFTALVESDPAYKIIEVCAYRELLMRQRVNDAAYAVMLAFATGTDLDQIGANLGVTRLVIDPGNPDTVPPTPPTYESDSEFRYRIQISFEGYSTAGPQGAYVFHGLSADGQVKDVSAISPAPGVVRVHVLSRATGGVPSTELLSKVASRLNDERVRPLTDNVEVLPAGIVEYAIEAELTLYPGPDAQVILAAAIKAAQDYATSVYRLGFDVARSGILRALHQPGVQSVNLVSPATNIVIADGQAPLCTGVDVSMVGVDD